MRACTPAPGAWTMLGDTRLKLWPVGAPVTGRGRRPRAPMPSGPPEGAGSLAPGELWAGRPDVFAGHRHQPGASWATCSRRASGGWPPPSGHADCTWTGPGRASRSWPSADMARGATAGQGRPSGPRAGGRTGSRTGGAASPRPGQRAPAQGAAPAAAGPADGARPGPADGLRCPPAVRPGTPTRTCCWPRRCASGGCTAGRCPGHRARVRHTAGPIMLRRGHRGLCADRPLDQIDPPVLEVLRLGSHQLLGMRIGPHAAVATTVDLAGKSLAAVRRVRERRPAPGGARDLESWIEVVAPDRTADLAGHLAVRYSHPRWIVTALADALGEARAGRCRAGQAGRASAGRTGTEDGPRCRLAQTGPRSRHQHRPAVTLAAPGLAGPGELAAAAPSPPAGRRSALISRVEIPARYRPWRSAGLACRTKPASWPPSPSPGPTSTPRTGLARPLCRSGREGAGCFPGSRRERCEAAAADARPHRASLWQDQLSPASAARWPPTARPRHGGPRCSTGSSPTCPVPASARCAGGPRHDGGTVTAGHAAPRRAPARATCRAMEATRPGGAVAYVTCSPHVDETRAVLDDVLARAGRRCACLTRPPCSRRCPACAARDPYGSTPSSGRTGTAPTPSSSPCSSASPS